MDPLPGTFAWPYLPDLDIWEDGNGSMSSNHLPSIQPFHLKKYAQFCRLKKQ